MQQDYPFTLKPLDIASSLGSDLDKGLSLDKARENLMKYGENQVPEHRPKKRGRILIDQLADPIIYILIVAAIMALFFRNWLEGFAIFVVILISISIGFIMEFKAVRSLEALRKMGQAVTTVIRSGQIVHSKASELVPGDIVLLESGDVISADARLVTADNLSVKESALTGESIAVSKNTEIIVPLDTPVTHQHNMVFKGTTVMTGFGKAIVTATGIHSQLGGIQQMGIDAQKHVAPLEKKLNQLSKWLIWLTIILATMVVVFGYLRGEDLVRMIDTGVALAVAAIPEGLPIVATIALAKGMLRLSKKQVIIKKMEAVETLGATDIICTDKTGTLTEDKMKVHSLILADRIVDVLDKDKNELDFVKNSQDFEIIVLASILCNNVKHSSSFAHRDALEIALLEFAEQMGYEPDNIRKKFPEIMELPFNAKRKLMATAHKTEKGYLVFVKGAYENIVGLCNTTYKQGNKVSLDNHEKWDAQVDTLAYTGLRTLAFAFKNMDQVPTIETMLQELSFIGVIGCLDPARNDVKETIEVYRNAGIKVVMVTGDHPGTSKKIAEEIGLLPKNAALDKVVTGENLKKLGFNGNKLNHNLLDVVVFARTSPEQKLDLIKFYQENNHVVGMIGDGINDVPALRKADIGITMGIRGTGAAREVADVILKNDKFTAIELAIHQGRVVFQNIRQFVVYLLSCNLAEILSVGLAALLSLPSPLLPLQILFLNLVTDTFPALALGMGKGQKDIMKKPPRSSKEPIMTTYDWKTTILYGITITMAVLGIVMYSDRVLELRPITINNMAFFTLVFAQLLNVFNMPGPSQNFIKNEVTTNKWVWGAIILSVFITLSAYAIPKVAMVLSLEYLTVSQLGLAVIFAFASLIVAQLLVRIGVFFKGYF
ncbi:cation-translocating P-type ATPase [Maribacter sp. CXY002]|uniref:cation-translocating P-type ATPase n=1 Tax=Maribacter luteocoastalis TaxID=3407671 RepID=UPI003B679BEB